MCGKRAVSLFLNNAPKVIDIVQLFAMQVNWFSRQNYIRGMARIVYVKHLRKDCLALRKDRLAEMKLKAVNIGEVSFGYEGLISLSPAHHCAAL